AGGNIKAAWLEPDTVSVRHPQTVIFQVGINNEVSAAPLIRIETVGETIEGSDRHAFSFWLKDDYQISNRRVKPPSGIKGLPVMIRGHPQITQIHTDRRSLRVSLRNLRNLCNVRMDLHFARAEPEQPT